MQHKTIMESVFQKLRDEIEDARSKYNAEKKVLENEQRAQIESLKAKHNKKLETKSKLISWLKSKHKHELEEARSAIAKWEEWCKSMTAELNQQINGNVIPEVAKSSEAKAKDGRNEGTGRREKEVRLVKKKSTSKKGETRFCAEFSR